MADRNTSATGIDSVLELAELLRPSWSALSLEARTSGLVCEGENEPTEEEKRKKKEEEEAAERERQRSSDPDAELLQGARNPDAVKNALKAEREAAAAAKKAADEALAKVKEYEDRDKTDQQKKEEAAAAAEKRAAEAEAKSLRFEVAAAKNIPLSQAHRLQGSTKEELEKDADAFVKDLREAGGARTSFDGGTRQDAPTGSIDDAIRQAAGRA